jgi:hypothetical protein
MHDPKVRRLRDQLNDPSFRRARDIIDQHKDFFHVHGREVRKSIIRTLRFNVSRHKMIIRQWSIDISVHDFPVGTYTSYDAFSHPTPTFISIIIYQSPRLVGQLNIIYQSSRLEPQLPTTHFQTPYRYLHQNLPGRNRFCLWQRLFWDGRWWQCQAHWQKD